MKRREELEKLRKVLKLVGIDPVEVSGKDNDGEYIELSGRQAQLAMMRPKPKPEQETDHGE